MAQTFVITVSDSPARVMVEDVRNGRRGVAPDLDAVGAEIARLIDSPTRAGGSNDESPR